MRIDPITHSEASLHGSLTALPGAYILTLHLHEARLLEIGRLGWISFSVGYHLYVGSAHGPGGLRGRLRHHLSPVTRPHWHVDYLRRVAPCVMVWYTTGAAAHECALADALAAMPGAIRMAPRFGASDCGCAGHLVSFKQPPDVARFATQAGVAQLYRLDLSAEA